MSDTTATVERPADLRPLSDVQLSDLLDEALVLDDHATIAALDRERQRRVELEREAKRKAAAEIRVAPKRAKRAKRKSHNRAARELVPIVKAREEVQCPRAQGHYVELLAALSEMRQTNRDAYIITTRAELPRHKLLDHRLVAAFIFRGVCQALGLHQVSVSQLDNLVANQMRGSDGAPVTLASLMKIDALQLPILPEE